MLVGEIEAIAFASEVPFEFRALRNNQPADLPLALSQLAEWQTFDPGNARLCYATLYPISGGTRGLDATGLAIETRGLFQADRLTLLVWKRH